MSESDDNESQFKGSSNSKNHDPIKNAQAYSEKKFTNISNLHQSQMSLKQNDKSERTILTLKSHIKKLEKQNQQLKIQHIKEIEQKSEIEKIVRQCINDIKDEIIKIKGLKNISNSKNAKQQEEWQKEDRIKFVDRLLNNEKILTFIYDKIFYPELKNIDFNINQLDND